MSDERKQSAMDALRTMLDGFDWYYKMSDDHSAYARGRDEWRVVLRLLDITGDEGRALVKEKRPENAPW